MKDSSFKTILKIRLAEEGLDPNHLEVFFSEKSNTLIKDLVTYFKQWEEKKYPAEQDTLNPSKELFE